MKLWKRITLLVLACIIAFSSLSTPAYAAVTDGFGVTELIDERSGTSGFMTCIAIGKKGGASSGAVNIVMMTTTGQARIKRLFGVLKVNNTFPGLPLSSAPIKAVSANGLTAQVGFVVPGLKKGDEVTLLNGKVAYMNNYGGTVARIYDSFFSTTPEVICAGQEDDNKDGIMKYVYGKIQERKRQVLPQNASAFDQLGAFYIRSVQFFSKAIIDTLTSPYNIIQWLLSVRFIFPSGWQQF